MMTTNGPKTWITELVAFSGADQEQDNEHSHWVRRRTAHVTRSNGRQEQWGLRPHVGGPEPDDYYEGRSLSEYQFERLVLLARRLSGRQNFACWSRYDPPAWHNGHYPYRELHIIRLRLPDGRPVWASLMHLTNYDLPAGQRRKLEALLAPGSPEERLYHLYVEAHVLERAATRLPAAYTRRGLVQRVQNRRSRRARAFERWIDTLDLGIQ